MHNVAHARCSIAHNATAITGQNVTRHVPLYFRRGDIAQVSGTSGRASAEPGNDMPIPQGPHSLLTPEARSAALRIMHENPDLFELDDNGKLSTNEIQARGEFGTRVDSQ